jgi:hypothetical protein
MQQRVLAGAGTFTEVCWHAGQWHVAWQEGTDTLVLAAYASDFLTQTFVVRWPLGEHADSFPRLLSWDGVLWLAFKAGAPDYPAILQRLSGDTGPPINLGTAYGNAPIALGAGYVAWQATKDYEVNRQPLAMSTPPSMVRMGAPDGLSRVLPDGSVRLVREDRDLFLPFLNPVWAGDAVALEGNGLFDVVQRTDGLQVRVFQGSFANTPRLAADGTGRHVIGTWGTAVQGALLVPSDFAAAVPVPIPEPPPVNPPLPPVLPDPPKPPTPPEKPVSVTPQQIHDTLAQWPWDVDVDHLARFRDNVWKRDQGGDVPSRGALAFYHRGVGAAIAQRCIDLGRGLNGAEEWNHAFDLGTDAAINAYKAQIGPGPEDGQDPQ